MLRSLMSTRKRHVHSRWPLKATFLQSVVAGYSPLRHAVSCLRCFSPANFAHILQGELCEHHERVVEPRLSPKVGVEAQAALCFISGREVLTTVYLQNPDLSMLAVDSGWRAGVIPALTAHRCQRPSRLCRAAILREARSRWRVCCKALLCRALVGRSSRPLRHAATAPQAARIAVCRLRRRPQQLLPWRRGRLRRSRHHLRLTRSTFPWTIKTSRRELVARL